MAKAKKSKARASKSGRTSAVKKKPPRLKSRSSASGVAKKSVGKKKGGRKKSKGKKPIDPRLPPKKPPKKIKKKWPPKKWPPKKRPPSTTPPAPSNLLQIHDFLPHGGTMFRLADFNPPHEIELVEVSSLPPIAVPDGFEHEIRSQPFSLLFLGPVNVEIPQGVYTVKHDVMDATTMMLVPVSPPGDSTVADFRMSLEAIYS